MAFRPGSLAYRAQQRARAVGAGLAGFITADLIVYGATPAGILAAYEARRQGKTAVIVGGWRERHVGGMMSGGLGGTDVDSLMAIGGLGFEVFRRSRTASGDIWNPSTQAGFMFQPRYAEQVFQQMLAERGIPVFLGTGGIVAATKADTAITEIQTADGRRYRGRVFLDATYEGDLLAKAGASFTVGREARNATTDPSNGFLGGTSTGHQFAIGSTFYSVSPYVVDGNSGSGLLPFVVAQPALAFGATDAQVQAYNFRMVLTKDSVRKVPINTAAPRNYDPLRYEALGRLLALATAGGTSMSQNDFLLFNGLNSAATVFDVNNKGGLSTDFIGGGSSEYPLAAYARREQIWQDHIDWVRGLFWFWATDSRVPSAIRTAIGNLGLDALHFTDPDPRDPLNWPYHLYVREARRLVGDFVLHENDLTAADGSTPRSIKTIAVASYKIDSHHGQRYAGVDSQSKPRVWNEGNVHANMGGTDKISPLPYEILLPKRAEATNLLVTCAPSVTHPCLGSLRMEFTFMQMGQSAGMAAAQVIDQGSNVAVHDLDYATFRSRMLALPEAVPAVLPQVA